MRLRFPQLKGAPIAAARFAGDVRQLDGVLAVEATAATGSVLVTYRADSDRALHFLPELEQVLARHGLAAPDTRRAAHAPAPAAGGVTDGVAARLVGAIVDKLVERSALALVVALL